MKTHEYLSSLIGKKVTAIGSCGMKKGVPLEGVLDYSKVFNYWIVNIDKNIPCMVIRQTIELLESPE